MRVRVRIRVRFREYDVNYTRVEFGEGEPLHVKSYEYIGLSILHVVLG
jgi:hypothetical protein